MEMSRQLPALVEAPFVVSDSVFVNSKFRGIRLPADSTNELFRRKQIRVHDARLLRRTPSLEVEGFELREAPVRVDFQDWEQVRAQFLEHCSNLVQAATGCLHARVMQVEFRDGMGKGPAGRGYYAPAAHADVCPYVEDVIDVPDGHHFGLFNVWRSIDPEQEIEVMPLALCDVATVAGDDIVYADRWRLTEPRTFLVDCRLIHDVGQCWYYFPRMTWDEALIFRQYDTRREDANRRTTFHTAFRDPTTREGAPLRRTVEVRVLAIFREEDPDPAGRRARFQAGIPKILPDGTISTVRHERMVDWWNHQ